MKSFLVIGILIAMPALGICAFGTGTICYRSPKTPRRQPTPFSRGLLSRHLFGNRQNKFLKSEFFPLDDIPQEERAFLEEVKLRPKFDRESLMEIVIPLMAPFIAFFSYDFVASTFDWTIDTLSDLTSDKNWVAVDGGRYQASIMTPVTNGVVLPAVAVLFATLTSTTISTLRMRQVEVLRAINMEAGELRVLESIVAVFPDGDLKDRCRNYLIQYTSRIIAESQPHSGFVGDDFSSINPRRGMDSELNGFLQQLNLFTPDISSHLAEESYAALARLREQRYNRISALEVTYPGLHYAILAALAIAECTGFLMEANQELLVFLNAVQLKILWSMLVGTFVACFTVFYDLRYPFSGSYQISASVDQLYTVRMALQAPVTSFLELESETKGSDSAVTTATDSWTPVANGSNSKCVAIMKVNGASRGTLNGAFQENTPEKEPLDEGIPPKPFSRTHSLRQQQQHTTSYLRNGSSHTPEP